MIGEVREKEELLKALLEEYNKLPRSVQRAGYTRRIMEIVKNIEKQKVDIDKVRGGAVGWAVDGA